MDRVKLIFFDKEENRMINWNELYLNDNLEINIGQEGLYLVDKSRTDDDGYEYQMDGVFHLFSGKKDMHSREIYDGYVLRVKGYSVPFIVSFQDGAFMLKAKDESLSMALNMYQADEIEVIGDIYQFNRFAEMN
ncbi:YopX family protein [Bacillus sp. NPDC094106]|uniref:YopX family protein n=1 Tax=Bacillus sp. NPDC094106 TaxID=3363949 RepID=UPI003824DF21